MIRGLLIDKETRPMHVIFICPSCGNRHGMMVDDVSYFTEAYNVWAFKRSNDSNRILELFPSYNSNTCDFHSEYNWNIEVMELQEGQTESESSNKWLFKKDE